jgi:hypothetical protein
MKRYILIILAAMFVLAGCAPQIIEPTFTENQLATRVNQILTSMPTQTGVPTLAPTEAEQSATAEATAEPSDTATAPTDEASKKLPTIESQPATEEVQPTETQAAVQDPAATTAATVTVLATATPGIPPTAPPTEVLPDSDPRRTLGSPTTTDDMSSPSTWNWPLGYSEFSEMTFKDGKMILEGLSDVSGWRLPILGPGTDMYIEMKARPQDCEGSDNYGIIFNIPVFKEADRGYLYSISCDGKYRLSKWDGKEGDDGKMTTLIWWKSNPAINTGSMVDNRLGVLVKDEKISLYANGILLDEKSDDMYRDGYFGVFVNPDLTENLTIEIDEMSYWDLD